MEITNECDVLKAKTLTKEEFKNELGKVKNDLPRHYGVILKTRYKNIKVRKVYNVVNYGVHDEEILKQLKSILGN